MSSFPVSSSKFQVSSLDVQTIADLLEMGGCPDDGDIAAVLGLLCQVLNEGSLCLPLDPDTLAARLADGGREKAGRLVKAFLEKATCDPFAALVARPEGYRPLVLAGPSERPLLYFHKYYQAERGLREGLTRLAGAPTGPPARALLPEEIFGEQLAMRAADGRLLKRDPLQEKAVGRALTGPLTLISGGPGTGKTTLLVTLLRCLARGGSNWERIAVAAPTGRAARRLTEAIERGIGSIRRPEPPDRDLLNLKGCTLHRLLRFSPSRNTFYYNRANPLDLDVVIVDEASMVDALLLAALIEAIDPRRTRLVLVGDKDQLPSVEAGAALADMVAGTGGLPDLPLAQLGQSHRVGPALAELAGRVNAGDCPQPAPANWDEALAQGPDSWVLVSADSPDRFRQGLSRWAQAVYLTPLRETGGSFKDLIEAATGPGPESEHQARLGAVFNAIGQARVLTLTREGPYGCIAANAQVARILCRQLAPWADPDRDVFNGALVMVVRNDYAKGLFNGDVGVALSQADGSLMVWFPLAGGFVPFAPASLPPWELAFAVTVHKSQGSEYDRVLLTLGQDPAHPLLTRELLYTGITRAKRQLIVHAGPSALAAAAGRKIQRFSGL